LIVSFLSLVPLNLGEASKSCSGPRYAAAAISRTASTT